MKQIKHTFRLLTLAALVTVITFTSCDDYLNVAPNDGIATEDMAFKMRSQAIKYLASCYSYLTDCTPGHVDYAGFLGGDEIYAPYNRYTSLWSADLAKIYLGYQNVTSPYSNNFISMYQAIRYCNTMAERIQEVPDMEQWEKDQWAAEAKVLKAYYMFYTIRKWGPIPIVRENLPIGASIEESRVFRDDIDECFDYVLELLDEAIPHLFDVELSLEDLGRITRPVAAMLKAKAAVYAASPLFNNNTDQASLVDKRGKRLFPAKSETEVQARWDAAVIACQEALSYCRAAGKSLYSYSGNFSGDTHLLQELTLREMICQNWNSEVIWGNTMQYPNNLLLQRATAINNNAEKYPDLWGLFGAYSDAVPLKIANQFYTKHGIPVENDLERMNVNPESLRQATDSEDERWYFQKDYTSAEFNFDREPRFYADLAFDGGYMLSSSASTQQPSDLPIVRRNLNANQLTGYSIKKLVKYSLVISSASSYSITAYIYPTFRLTDLYLLYAEAINEAEGPNGAHSDEMFRYLDAIRSRAGIPGVKEAWDNYSNAPGKYNTQIGMREIIHRERNIEMAFESERFYDIRRWKEAPVEYQTGTYGWDISAGTRSGYYTQTEIVSPSFSLKDYFWPFSTAILENNNNLIQNVGW